MKPAFRLFIVGIVFGMLTLPLFAQNQPLVHTNISLGCNKFKLYVDSDYEGEILMRVNLKRPGSSDFDLYQEDNGSFRVPLQGTGTKFYDIPDLAQGTEIRYEVDIKNAQTRVNIQTVRGTEPCRGVVEEFPPAAPTQQAATPVSAANFVTLTCDTSGTLTITSNIGAGRLTATAEQRTNALLTAQLARQNQLITGTPDFALYALTPAELQVNIAGADAQYPIDICGALTFTPTTTTPTTPTISTNPVITSSSGACTVSGSRTHIVQRGENLFRIGLRYGVGFRELARFNGITDPTRIYVGQCIAIP